MLTQLSIRNVVLIEKLDLFFDRGLTVFTGETGAGKSILLDSLGLALGERASSSLVRVGTNQATVTACFEVPISHPVYTQLAEQGFELAELSETNLVIRRIIAADGRSRAYINDQPVSLNFLKEISQNLVEMQGQHEQVGLMDPRGHLNILDNFGVSTNLLQKIKLHYSKWIEATAKLSALRATIEATAHEEEWLRESVEELKRLAPQSDEELDLIEKRKNLQQDERRQEALTSALAQLSPQDRRAFQPAQALLNASKSLQKLLPSSMNEQNSLSSTDQAIQEALEAIIRSEEALGEAENIVNHIINDIHLDPQLLDDIEERLFSLRAAGRKYGVNIDELSNLLQNFETRLLNLDLGNHQIKDLEQEVATCRASFEDAAEKLSTDRKKVAKKLENSITQELTPLKLDRAKFFVSITPLPNEAWNQTGKDQVQFLIAANPGVPPAPLNKAASGGELSRLLLALKVVLSQQSTLSALVFDEIDSGVGGSTASAIGDRLHHVAQNLQVFVVTHSPQVAASGDMQLKISKTIENGVTLTHTKQLSADERREEIARMLAGNHVTDAARAAADSLLHRSN
ncbi:DNA repair protein RecN [Commensalibacter papalotli (ex Servin-Garciduenas et al. 2014)]|uniref:DNA repair protein RecN n=1 Tax=Commensalibacter papalotli (ex Servin-Garciduenas et al. 2014) TaxID=1208583 RepID=W7DZG5_9PROT|nr:DNA repair protein RecN [Commensalibacter papalotli (ex Servin-Garciduenas et al. 2014)]EUK18089.1 DNA repair protein RecN [Commensalibacter papalotli (ex Servin-Garciduenas et al. 2014)]